MDRSKSAEFQANIYRNGRKAFDAGRSRDDNPYVKYSLAFKSWDAGWGDRNDENRAEAKEHAT